MKINTSTTEKISPSPQTISIIKHIAYAYSMIKQQGKSKSFSINQTN